LHALLLITGLLGLAAGPGFAAESAPATDAFEASEHRTPSWDFGAAELAREGLGQSRGDAVIPQNAPVSGTRDAQHAADAPTVLFLNFDGAELIQGGDDSRSNVTTLDEHGGVYPAYGGGEGRREAVLQAVRDDWSAYNVIVTDRRPDSGDYVMAMIGPSDAAPAGTLGQAILDCGNERTTNNIVFAYHGGDGHTTASTATTISQEIGHSFGLEHVNESSAIMNPTNVGGDPAFRDECLPLAKEAKCVAQHEAQCDAGSQNAHRELYDLIGPAGPDAGSPGVRIIAPQDGENFDIDETFDIVIEADDGVVIHRAALFVNDKFQGTDDAAPYGWAASQVVEGVYALEVEIQDTQGLIRISNTVEVTVGRAGPVLYRLWASPGAWGHGAASEPQGCACSMGDGGTPMGASLLTLIFIGAFRRRNTRAA